MWISTISKFYKFQSFKLSKFQISKMHRCKHVFVIFQIPSFQKVRCLEKRSPGTCLDIRNNLIYSNAQIRLPKGPKIRKSWKMRFSVSPWATRKVIRPKRTRKNNQSDCIGCSDARSRRDANGWSDLGFAGVGIGMERRVSEIWWKSADKAIN